LAAACNNILPNWPPPRMPIFCICKYMFESFSSKV
jgi:hypothetical protein